MATNNELKEILQRIEAKLDVSVTISGLASKKDLEDLKYEIDEIKRVVQIKQKK